MRAGADRRASTRAPRSRSPASGSSFTAADLPAADAALRAAVRDRPVLAVGETKYHGDPVAAVAAETLDAAEEAAAPRPGRVRGAAGGLHDRRGARPGRAARPGPVAPARRSARRHERPARAPLRLGRRRRRGRDADLVVEGTYTFPMVTQFAIEPHAFIAAPDGDGIAIWSSIQHPNWLQRVIAGLLDLPLAKVRVFAPDPGGAFGGKQHAKYEPLVAFMALRGRPAGPPRADPRGDVPGRPPRRIARSTSGPASARDGTLVFRDIEANYLIGAYADIADRTVAKGSYTSTGPYRVPAVRIVARSILSHTVPSTAFRGFGNPQQIWAVESNMNEAARVARHRPARPPPAEPRPPGRGVHPGRHARPTATGPGPSSGRPR